MAILADLKARLEKIFSRGVEDAQAAAHSSAGQILIKAAEDLAPLIPDGREAALVATKLEEAAMWADHALHLASTTAQTAAPPAAAATTGTASDAGASAASGGTPAP
jgi:hypothetical protein